MNNTFIKIKMYSVDTFIKIMENCSSLRNICGDERNLILFRIFFAVKVCPVIPFLAVATEHIAACLIALACCMFYIFASVWFTNGGTLKTVPQVTVIADTDTGIAPIPFVSFFTFA